MAIEIKKSAEYQNENTIATRLNSIEWDFQYSNKSRRSIHSFHSYPAKFIPEIPKTLIRELSPPKNTIVLDPFCGCGTTLVEAQLAGYDSIGIDLNPIGCLISQVKTTPLPPDFLSAVEICLNKSRKNSNIQLPNIPNLSHWFRPDISEALASIIFSIRTTKDPIIKKA
ncbi:MAG TPA: DNA methyltransferase, partial [Dissulfurispiraceae bacterium]